TTSVIPVRHHEPPLTRHSHIPSASVVPVRHVDHLLARRTCRCPPRQLSRFDTPNLLSLATATSRPPQLSRFAICAHLPATRPAIRFPSQLSRLDITHSSLTESRSIYAKPSKRQ